MDDDDDEIEIIGALNPIGNGKMIQTPLLTLLNTGSPRYSRTFNQRFCLFIAILRNLSPYLCIFTGLDIRGTSI